ncbi:hypothetical protein COV16_06225 [Candidatus Woesearchaeota archaeon CG10_big_fil_rev_8_21_14_0_10_34_8]|nr:MAG: hypothetical protein COV16_06225 [Candidatus Woesearchaeota archaeon CG10_big_fil_rev_8_21_14_0_10_34_8]
MQDHDLRIQHIIVLTALFVSLFGSLLVLDKINDNAIPITGATAVINLPHQEQSDHNQEEQAIRVVKINMTDH